MIVETNLSFIDIAFSTGFDSVRRFNDAIRLRFSKTPTALRKRKSKQNDGNIIKFSAAYRPPLDWQSCLNYYEKHTIGDLEKFEDGCYIRTFQFENDIGMVTVRNNEQYHRLEISLQIDNVNAVSFVLGRVKTMFDLFLDPVYVANGFEIEPAFRALYESHHGVRLARCWDRFELVVSTILGQLISVKHATQLTHELMELYGERRINPISGDKITLFPGPEKLAEETLTALKIPRTKKIAIITLARQVTNGEIHFSSYQDPEAFKSKLMEIRGIGRWTAEYVALRAIGDTDAFPEGDAYLDKIVNTKDLDKLSPWRGYLATILYKYGEEI